MAVDDDEEGVCISECDVDMSERKRTPPLSHYATPKRSCTSALRPVSIHSSHVASYLKITIDPHSNQVIGKCQTKLRNTE